jgi:RNA 3'-terminal phosphate cyclase (ATP)
VVANLPRSIAERELAVIGRQMGWSEAWLHVESMHNSPGPGNIVTIEIECEHVTEVFTGFGARGVSAEAVAEHAVQEARRYLAADVVAGVHLADQLLVPLTLAGGGSFTTLPLSPHALTNIGIIQQFLTVGIEARPRTARTWQVTVQG